MPCYHPLIMYEHATKKSINGKKLIVSKPTRNPTEWKTIELPCGQCIGCRLEYSKQWATRCVLEAKLYKYNYFITLTYSPENIPTVPHIDKDTGEYIDMGTLKKRDVQLFLKRLRKYYKDNFNHEGIRFYLAGEYGENTERPHYHAIIFNLPIPDLKPYFINHEHQQIYTSEIIDKIWGLGITSVGEVTYQSAAYVARYIMKKQKGGGEPELSRLPEFTQMSLKPGIGTEYYNLKKEEIQKYDELILPVRGGHVASIMPPKFFDKLTEKDNPDLLESIKAQRLERAQESRANKNTQTSLREDQQRAVAERNMIAKANTLRRGMTEI